MIDGNQLREEFGRYLAEHKATRWGMDAALMHVCKIAYDAGKADGPATPERKVGMHPALGAEVPTEQPCDEDSSYAKAVLDELYSQEFEIEVPVEPGLHPLVFTGLPLQNWRDEQLHALCKEMGEALDCLIAVYDSGDTGSIVESSIGKCRRALAKWKESK